MLRTFAKRAAIMAIVLAAFIARAIARTCVSATEAAAPYDPIQSATEGGALTSTHSANFPPCRLSAQCCALLITRLRRSF